MDNFSSGNNASLRMRQNIIDYFFNVLKGLAPSTIDLSISDSGAKRVFM